MKIIKDKQIIDDNWTHLADNEETVTAGDITVSLGRWKENKMELKGYSGNVGVRLLPADKVEEIAADLVSIKLIALEFPVFTDGRGFSHARLLRDRYGFTGEIRAIGHFIPDQVFYLSRVGINAFQLDKPDDLPLALSTLGDFTVKYQLSTH